MKKAGKNLVTLTVIFLNLLISQTAFSSGINGYSGNPAHNAGNSCMSCHPGGVIPIINLTGPLTVQPGSINTYTLTLSGGQANSGGRNYPHTTYHNSRRWFCLLDV